MDILSARKQRGIIPLMVERADAEEVREAREKVLLEEMLAALLEAMPVCIRVLNRERQVLAVNHQLLTTFGINNHEPLIGRRPGEVVNCVQAAKEPGGCGSGEFCCNCELLLAIIESQQMNIGVTRPFSLTINDDLSTCMDIEVVATPLEVAGMCLTVLALRDIGTYSIKLFGERYLKGKVRVVSFEPEGTTFCVDLPKYYFAHTNLPPVVEPVGDIS